MQFMLMARKLELRSPESCCGGGGHKGRASLGKYSEVSRELDRVRGGLRRLKVDMDSASEAKANAEKEIEASGMKAAVCPSFVEELKREIGAANGEQLLVELARMEAEIELGDIEARRAAEAVQFSAAMEKAKRRISDRRKEIRRAKELEIELAVTTSDVNVLQGEMKFFRATEMNSQENQIKKSKEELLGRSLLRATEAESEAAKKELAHAREKGFQLMAAMDLIRGELMHIGEESEGLAAREKAAESAVRNLNSKLIKSKLKLESALVADERTDAILVNLSAALQQLRTDVEVAKKEKDVASEEIKSIEMETDNIKLGTDWTEARLQAAMEELRAVKASESIALAKLKAVTERRTRATPLPSQHSSSITISDFEYKYLRGRAEAARELADDKVDAAQAWIEALEARETEILLHAEIVQREIKELGVVGESETGDPRSESLDLRFAVESSRYLRGENGVPGESRRAKRRPSASSGRRQSITRSPRSTTRSPSFTFKKKTKVMINLVRFLKGQGTGKLK